MAANTVLFTCVLFSSWVSVVIYLRVVMEGVYGVYILSLACSEARKSVKRCNVPNVAITTNIRT